MQNVTQKHRPGTRTVTDLGTPTLIWTNLINVCQPQHNVEMVERKSRFGSGAVVKTQSFIFTNFLEMWKQWVGGLHRDQNPALSDDILPLQQNMPSVFQ